MNFIMGLLLVMVGFKEVDLILVIVDRYMKMSFFFPMNMLMNAAELIALFY